MYHGFCNKGGCHVDAKNSPLVTTIPKAQKTGQLQGRDARARDDDRRRRNGRASRRHLRHRRRRVLSAGDGRAARDATPTRTCGTLLLSKSKAFPNGLVEQSRPGRTPLLQPQPGRRRDGAVSEEPEQLVRAAGAGHRRRRLGRRQLRSLRARLHRRRQPVGVLRSPSDCRRRAWTRSEEAPSWGSAWKAFIKENADRTNTAYLQKTTLPYEDNYLDLDPAVKDPLGDPGLPHHRDVQGERTQARGVHSGQDGAVVPGGGRDRGRSAAPSVPRWASRRTRTAARAWATMLRRTSSNRWGFSHEVPNLGILGASVMGTSGARNPTLTAQALAWRTAEHLVKNWKTIAESIVLGSTTMRTRTAAALAFVLTAVVILGAAARAPRDAAAPTNGRRGHGRRVGDVHRVRAPIVHAGGGFSAR